MPLKVVMPVGRGKCDCCRSEHRVAIDTAIVAGVGYRVIAERFNVGRSSVTRHAKSHLTQAQRAALATAAQPTGIDANALAEREGSNLLAHVAAQRQRLLTDADTARQLGDVTATVAAERALTATLIVTGKLVGQFITKIDVRHQHLLLDPEWLELRRDIMEELQRFPEAMRAVAARMQAREATAARKINPPKTAPLVIEHQPTLSPCPVPLP